MEVMDFIGIGWWLHYWNVSGNKSFRRTWTGVNSFICVYLDANKSFTWQSLTVYLKHTLTDWCRFITSYQTNGIHSRLNTFKKDNFQFYWISFNQLIVQCFNLHLLLDAGFYKMPVGYLNNHQLSDERYLVTFYHFLFYMPYSIIINYLWLNEWRYFMEDPYIGPTYHIHRL